MSSIRLRSKMMPVERRDDRRPARGTVRRRDRPGRPASCRLHARRPRPARRPARHRSARPGWACPSRRAMPSERSRRSLRMRMRLRRTGPGRRRGRRARRDRRAGRGRAGRRRRPRPSARASRASSPRCGCCSTPRTSTTPRRCPAARLLVSGPSRRSSARMSLRKPSFGLDPARLTLPATTAPRRRRATRPSRRVTARDPPATRSMPCRSISACSSKASVDRAVRAATTRAGSTPTSSALRRDRRGLVVLQEAQVPHDVEQLGRGESASSSCARTAMRRASRAESSCTPMHARGAVRHPVSDDPR